MEKLKNEIKLGASNNYLADWIKKLKIANRFLGVFSVDDLKCNKDAQNMESFLHKGPVGTTLIFNNTTSNQNGEHWLMLTKISQNIVFFFDSFGAENFKNANYGQNIHYKTMDTIGNFTVVRLFNNKSEKEQQTINGKYLNHFLFTCLQKHQIISYKNQLQSFKSNLCGFYCLMLYNIINKRHPNITEITNKLLRLGIKTTKRHLDINDQIVTNYFKQRVKR